MITVNRKSDLKVKFTFKNKEGKIISPESIDWRMKFFVTKSRMYEVSNINGVKMNWVHNSSDDHILFEKHNLGSGVMKYTIELLTEDKDFADGIYNYVTTEKLTNIKWI